MNKYTHVFSTDLRGLARPWRTAMLTAQVGTNIHQLDLLLPNNKQLFTQFTPVQAKAQIPFTKFAASLTEYLGIIVIIYFSSNLSWTSSISRCISCPATCPIVLLLARRPSIVLAFLEVNALIRRWLILKLLPEKVAGVGYYCRIA